MVLAPSEVAFACPGGLLSLTCSTNETYIEWAVDVPGYPKQIRSFDTFGSTLRQFEQAIIGSTMFNFSKEINISMNLSLISMILVENMIVALNGTTIDCTEITKESEVGSTLTTNIHIIGNEADHSKLI